MGQHLLRHGAPLHHPADELAALVRLAGHAHPLVRWSGLLEVPLLLTLLEVALLLLLLQVDRAVPLLVLLLHLLLRLANGLRHLLRSHALLLLLLLLNHHALLLPLVRHALHLHLGGLALGLLGHHLGATLSPALYPGSLAALLILLLLLRSLLDECRHQARVALQNTQDLLVLLL